MKKKIDPIDFASDEKEGKEAIYKTIKEAHEELIKKKQDEEKEVLLRKLQQVTKNKSIVLSNYLGF